MGICFWPWQGFTFTLALRLENFFHAQLNSTQFQLLIKTKIILTNKEVAFSLSDVAFIMLINVKCQQLLTF